MSIKISKIKNLLKGTYDCRESINACYWNQGYLCSLLNEGKIDMIEHAGLDGYNDRLYFVENMKIKEEEKEMKLEEIRKRIDGDLKEYASGVIQIDDNIREALAKIVSERNKALKTYKELIEKVQRMNLISDKRELQVDTNYQITEHIKYLEEKYYPRPKPKTAREKLTDFINKQIRKYPLLSEDIIKELEGIRDEMEE